jgi:integration host factor subunit beta
MNKLKLIDRLKEETGLTKPEAQKVIEIFFVSMTDAMAKGERVELRGLCSFFVKEYKSYMGRNPKTGEKVKIEPKKLPFFKAGKELKERVDNGDKPLCGPPLVDNPPVPHSS